MTDHQTLRSLMDQQVLTRAQTRWMKLGLFQSISPTIQYNPGKVNIIADALSRSRLGLVEEPKSTGTVMTLTASSAVPEAEVQLWKSAMEDDPNLMDAVRRLRGGHDCGGLHLTPQGLLYMEQEDRRRLVVTISLRQRILRECHDIPSVGHVGIRRTLELLERSYHWRGMRKRLLSSTYETYPTCQMIKADNRKKAGALQPIPPPEMKWSQVTTDLVTDLPESEGYTAVAVFVDRLTKRVHFAPCTKEITASEYAKIFVDTVFRHHGLPEVIISDRDPRFYQQVLDNVV